MTVTIKIKCDNAAFEDSPAVEVARILVHYATIIRDIPKPFGCGLFDINGNTVGSVKVS